MPIRYTYVQVDSFKIQFKFQKRINGNDKFPIQISHHNKFNYTGNNGDYEICRFLLFLNNDRMNSSRTSEIVIDKLIRVPSIMKFSSITRQLEKNSRQYIFSKNAILYSKCTRSQTQAICLLHNRRFVTLSSHPNINN